MRLVNVDEVCAEIIDKVGEINRKLLTAKAPSVDYLSGQRKALVYVYLLLHRLSVTTKESDYETH